MKIIIEHMGELADMIARRARNAQQMAQMASTKHQRQVWDAVAKELEEIVQMARVTELRAK